MTDKDRETDGERSRDRQILQTKTERQRNQVNKPTHEIRE